MLETVELNDIITNNMGEYSTYVLLSRAIPDIRDGLKPSYRRIIWTMKEMGATKLTKSANIEGEVMKYHPHGSTYPTMVGMVQKDAQLNPFLEGKGNFSSHSSELAFASSRYSEAKLGEPSLDMLSDVNKNGVDMIDNYDSTRKIPEVFPTKYPNILAYAQSGIGVGFSSSIPSFNITELNNAVINYLESGKETYIIPDFGTGATVINDKDIVQSINEEGRGSIKQRAKTEIEALEIVITEIPYNTTKEKIIDKIIKLHKEDKLKEVKNVEDLSGLSGLEVVVTAKRGTDMEYLLEKLYKETPMETSFPSNIMVINTDGLPEQMGVWDIIKEWVEWRRSVIVRMLNYDNELKSNELEILYGLNKIKDDLDKVVEVIRNSTDENVNSNLSNKFDLTEPQAKKIADLKLRNLNSTYLKQKIDKISTLEESIKENTENIKSTDRQNKLIIKDLKEVNNKFGKDRQSEVIEASEVVDTREYEEQLMEEEDYNVAIVTTKENYVKKIKLTSLRGSTEHKLKHGDSIIEMVETTNYTGEVLAFTNKQNVYKVQVSELKDTKASNLGDYIPSLINLQKGEEVIYTTIRTEDSPQDLLIGFDNGKLARINLDAYKTKTNRTKLKNAYSDKGTPLYFNTITEDINLLAQSTDSKTLILNTETFTSKSSKITQGATFIKLKKGQIVDNYTHDLEDIDIEYYKVKSPGVGKLWK